MPTLANALRLVFTSRQPARGAHPGRQSSAPIVKALRLVLGQPLRQLRLLRVPYILSGM